MLLTCRKYLVIGIIFVLFLISGCGGGGKKSTPSGGTPVAVNTVINTGNISIAKWFDNATCAVTFSFDDNLESHYTQSALLLEKYGWRGTFFVNPGYDTSDYGEYMWGTDMKAGHRALAVKGHEIGNHGWAHEDLTLLSGDKLRSEIENPIARLTADIGVRPLSFAHPYNVGFEDNTINNVIFEKHLFSRLASVHDTQNRIFIDLLGKEFSGTPPTTLQDLGNGLNDAYNSEKWLILTGHGVVPVTVDGWLEGEVTTQLLEPFCELIKNKGKVWVGTLAQVGAYEYMKQEVTLGTPAVEVNNLRVLFNWSDENRTRFTKCGLNEVFITLILPALPQQANLNVYLDGNKARYDVGMGAYIGTVNIIGKDSIVISATR